MAKSRTTGSQLPPKTSLFNIVLVIGFICYIFQYDCLLERYTDVNWEYFTIGIAGFRSVANLYYLYLWLLLEKIEIYRMYMCLQIENS